MPELLSTRKNKTQRSVKLNYKTDFTDDTIEKVAQVFVSHDTYRKAFIATLNLVTVKDETGYQTEAFFPFDGVTLGRQPVGRYSEKALDTFVAEIQHHLPAMIEQNAHVARIFRGEDK